MYFCSHRILGRSCILLIYYLFLRVMCIHALWSCTKGKRETRMKRPHEFSPSSIYLPMESRFALGMKSPSMKSRWNTMPFRKPDSISRVPLRSSVCPCHPQVIHHPVTFRWPCHSEVSVGPEKTCPSQLWCASRGKQTGWLRGSFQLNIVNPLTSSVEPWLSEDQKSYGTSKW